MGSSSRHGTKKELDERALILRRRLHDALCLGIRYDDKEKKWKCSDVEMQAHALRQMRAFVGCISPAVSRHALVKDSVSDMLVALENILKSSNEKICYQAADVTLKLVIGLGNSVHQYSILGVTESLLCLLASRHLPVSTSSAITLNHLLANISSSSYGHQKDMWGTVERADAIGTILRALQEYMPDAQSLEFFLELVSLLSTIMWKWPPSRYRVCCNRTVILKLSDCVVHLESSASVGILKLYSAIALCGDGAMKLLKNEDALSNILQAIEPSRSIEVRVETLKLFQNLTRSFEGCSSLISLHCKSIVQGIVTAMGGWRSSSKKIPANQMSMVIEATHTAMMTQWSGNHHQYFWRLGIDRVLLDILINDCSIHNQGPYSVQQLISIILDDPGEVRPYIWDILGWISVHCEENMLPKANGKTDYLDILVSCACYIFIDLMRKGRFSLSLNKYECEPVCRTVLMMLSSPCKYIASTARCSLSKQMKPDDIEVLENLLASLKLSFDGFISLEPNSLQPLLNLIHLACFSAFPYYRKHILANKGLQILSLIIKRCLDSDIHVNRSTISYHLRRNSDGRSCCWSNFEDAEGGDIILFYSLQAVSHLVAGLSFICGQHGSSSEDHVVCMSCQNYDSQVLVQSLHNIMLKNTSSGPRWYAGYILSFFGFFGFPSKLGKRMLKAVNDHRFADCHLVSSGQSIAVHSVILAARCPSLLPPGKRSTNLRECDESSSKEQTTKKHETHLRCEVRLSDRVDYQALMKILEYTYTGILQVDGNLLMPLRVLSKLCELKHLYHMLQGDLPRWVDPLPSCDFSRAIEAGEHSFSDVILEAKAADKIVATCSQCQLPTVHLHAHKIILWCNCDYLHALFQSGMLDSYSQIVEVPVGWLALVKLVSWFYTGKLPRINLGCAWNNMDPDQRLLELQAYVELCSLAKFWLLDEVLEESFDVLVSSIGSDQKISISIISTAIDLNQWEVVETAVSKIAFLYPKMRESGDLESLSEEVVEMLRSQYVRQSQEGLAGGCIPKF